MTARSRMTWWRNGGRGGWIAFALMVGLPPLARADAIPASLTYDSTGSFTSASPTIRFEGVTGASFGNGPNLAVGQFVISPPPAGSITYDDIPFAFTVRVPQLDKVVPDTPPAYYHTYYVGTIEVQGHFNGTVQSNGQSNVIATFDFLGRGSVAIYPEDHVVYDFPIPLADLKLPPSLALDSSSRGAATPVTIEVVPEPTVLCMGAAVLAGLGLRRSFGKGRRTSL
jgi:hypothetical protein